ncbi:MAG: FAD-binding oxidoreductase [bacterium]|nr:FAD-binding oxidoreductase [bacterium]
MIHARKLPAAPLPEILEDPGVCGAYCEDASGAPPGFASGLCRPEDEEQASALLRDTGCRPVLVQAARSSLTGGAIPRGEIVVSVERMCGISVPEPSAAGRASVRVGAGARLSDLERELAGHGLYYPPVPTFREAMLGGTVSTNAGGASSFKYGATREWVRALRVLLHNGDLLELRRGEHLFGPGETIRIRASDGAELRAPVPNHRLPPLKKISAGYHSSDPLDLVDLFVGSEGTLGLITEVTLDLVPLPPAVVSGFVFLDNAGTALHLAADLRAAAARAREEPDSTLPDVRSIEWVDARSLALLRDAAVPRRLRLHLPDAARAGVLFEVELPRPVESSEAQQAIADHLDGVSRVDGPLPELLDILLRYARLDDVELAFPGDDERLAGLRELREAVPTAVNELLARRRVASPGVVKVGGDFIVPFDRVPQMLERCTAAFEARELDYAIWGHLSDGNLHPNAIAREAGEVEAGEEALLELADAAVRAGGCPLSEHGVGRSPLKQRLLRRFVGGAALDRMREIKRGLDPAGRFSPGVLFRAD